MLTMRGEGVRVRGGCAHFEGWGDYVRGGSVFTTYVYMGSVVVCGGVGVGGAGCTVVSRSPPHSVTTIQQLSDMASI